MSTLAPEHREDLRKSGLTDATVDLLRLTALPPDALHRKVKTAVSAYTIPYFDLSGKVNGFQRLRLFPPVKGNNGTIKYFQAPGSSPHLYLPPLVDWQAVAKDASKPLNFTEGEKKAACGCQQGLTTAGIGGVWNWTSTLDNGDKIVLPLLDEFQWRDRPVLVCPDSDGWREETGWNILAGFFALAKDLQARGALVQFVVLPDLHGIKAGLDDWLLVPGNEVECGWPKLERISLDDARFNALSAWWQKWKGKHANSESLRTQHAEALNIQGGPGFYTVSFASHPLQFRFERLTDARGGVHAELSITSGATELLGSTDISLKSDSARTTLARNLNGLAASYPWKRLIERACTVVLSRHREGEPVIVLTPSDSVNVPFLLNPLIYEGHQALMYAPGGSLKSYVALAVALQASHGACIAGISAVRVPVLYLDWELNAETVGGRLKALQTGHPELSEFVPYYRRCEAPLHQEVHQIARQVEERGVKLLIVDSAAMACGGDLASPDAAIKLQRALRQIGCASLVLAHTSKGAAQEGQEKTAYGTVFFRELARNVWEVQRADGDNPVRIALHQKKNNFGPIHPPLGLEFNFSSHAVQVTACNPEDEPQFEARLPIPSRIRNLLEDGVPRTTLEIETELGAKSVTIKSALSRGKGYKWQQVVDDSQTPKWTVLRAR